MGISDVRNQTGVNSHAQNTMQTLKVPEHSPSGDASNAPLWRVYLPGPGVLGARGGLLPRLLVHLLVVLFVSGARLLAGGGVVGDLVGRPHVIDCTELLGQSC